MGIVAVQHLADGSLDPATHEISEYVHGPLGWLMTVGLAAWALSLVALAAALRSTTRGRAVAGAALLAAVGLALTAGFATQTSAGRLPPGVSLRTGGRLHDVGSGLATLALAAAAILSLRTGIPRTTRRLVISLLLLALLGELTLLPIGAAVAGARQRLLVGLACAWQLMLSSSVGARDGPPASPGGPSPASRA